MHALLFGMVSLLMIPQIRLEMLRSQIQRFYMHTTYPELHGQPNILAIYDCWTFHSKTMDINNNNLHSPRKAFHRGYKTGCRDFLPFNQKNISDVGHRCWAIQPGSQSVLQFIPKVFELSSFTLNLFMDLALRTETLSYSNRKGFPQTVAQSWKHTGCGSSLPGVFV